MAIKAVIFDLDNTLVFSMAMWEALFNDATSHFGVATIPGERLFELFANGMKGEEIAPLFAPHGKDEVSEYVVSRVGKYISKIQLEPDARRLFTALKNAGVKIAVCTNGPSESAVGILSSQGLQADFVIGHFDVENIKPAPDMLLRAMEKFGATPEETIMVGDHNIDAGAARAAGVRFAGLGIEGDYTLSRLGELLPHLGLDAT